MQMHCCSCVVVVVTFINLIIIITIIVIIIVMMDGCVLQDRTEGELLDRGCPICELLVAAYHGRKPPQPLFG